jgi:hypothetical protein
VLLLWASFAIWARLSEVTDADSTLLSESKFLGLPVIFVIIFQDVSSGSWTSEAAKSYN